MSTVCTASNAIIILGEMIRKSTSVVWKNTMKAVRKRQNCNQHPADRSSLTEAMDRQTHVRCHSSISTMLSR